MASQFPLTRLLLLSLFLLTVDQGDSFVVSSGCVHQRSFRVFCSDDDGGVPELPSCIQSPVLQQVYPSLLKHREEYGNPNIPLGSSDGRMCKTLRRLQIQKKLTAEEVELLQDIGFVFNSLEDVYHEVEFDELLSRLLGHKEEYSLEGYQIPKKFAQDPELGAWVTGLRRLGPTGVAPEHAKALDSIGFVWKSNRKCGSAFMKQYREYRELAQKNGDDILRKDESILKWVQAQREADARGSLSETRNHYMAQLFGEDWKTPVKR